MSVARSQIAITALVVALAAIQLTFAWNIRGTDPKRDYLEPPPSVTTQQALAFGDDQFLYRVFALEVQNAGDTGGRIVPVKNYDFDRVIGWLEVLSRMDPRSNFAVTMAGGFFGQSQHVDDVAPIVRFMMRNVDRDPRSRWRGLLNAIYLARHRLQDDDLALQAARQLAAYDFDGLDPWATLAPAFILEDQGHYAEAVEVVRATRARFAGRLSADDDVWTTKYIDFLLQVEAGAMPPRPRGWQKP